MLDLKKINMKRGNHSEKYKTVKEEEYLRNTETKFQKKSSDDGLCKFCKKSQITNTLLKRCNWCSIYCN